MVTVNFKKLTNNAEIPYRGSSSAAGYDLKSCETIIVPGQLTRKVHTGLAMEIPEGYFGAIFARSGLATKNGLRPANCVGVVDSDYRGEVIVALHNDSDIDFNINTGDRIAQLVIMPYLPVEFNQVKELDETERGTGGFNSTGIH